MAEYTDWKGIALAVNQIKGLMEPSDLVKAERKAQIELGIYDKKKAIDEEYKEIDADRKFGFDVLKAQLTESQNDYDTAYANLTTAKDKANKLMPLLTSQIGTSHETADAKIVFEENEKSNIEKYEEQISSISTTTQELINKTNQYQEMLSGYEFGKSMYGNLPIKNQSKVHAEAMPEYMRGVKLNDGTYLGFDKDEDGQLSPEESTDALINMIGILGNSDMDLNLEAVSRGYLGEQNEKEMIEAIETESQSDVRYDAFLEDRQYKKDKYEELSQKEIKEALANETNPKNMTEDGIKREMYLISNAIYNDSKLEKDRQIYYHGLEQKAVGTSTSSPIIVSRTDAMMKRYKDLMEVGIARGLPNVTVEDFNRYIYGDEEPDTWFGFPVRDQPDIVLTEKEWNNIHKPIMFKAKDTSEPVKSIDRSYALSYTAKAYRNKTINTDTRDKLLDIIKAYDDTSIKRTWNKQQEEVYLSFLANIKTYTPEQINKAYKKFITK